MARRYPVLILFFSLSGVSGLIYESIWTHYLKLFLGHAAYAQTLVLAIFMGGMALGSYLSSRYMGRWRNLFLGYALAEGAIGLSALLFHEVFEKAVSFSFNTAIPALSSPATVNAYKWLLSSALIFPQTVLLGMTFPLMSGAVLRRFPEDPGKSLALLYFANSIGAAAGVVASGFWLVSLAGLPGTIRLAGMLNIAIAAAIWYMSAKEGPQVSPVLSAKPEEVPAGRGLYRALLAVSLLTGTASFIYEVGWIRMLSLVLGSSTHAFELMLSAFILGLALGGLWIQKRIDRIGQPLRYLLFIQLIMGVLALLTLPLYGSTFEVMQWLMKNIAKTEGGYALFNISSHALASAIMLPAAFCAGMTLPLITYILLQRGFGERSIGAVYAANTIGAIAGVFFAIHLGLPLLGLKGLLAFGAGLDILLGLALLWSPAAGYPQKKIPAAVTAFSLAVIAGVLLFVELDSYKMASGVYREGGTVTQDNSRLVFHEDGKTATVSMVLQNSGVMQIRTNGKPDASIHMRENAAGHIDEATMVFAAALPLSLNPNAKTAANIGLGSGLTTHALLGSSQLERVDTIEIEREMVNGARKFGNFVDRAFTDPRSSIYIEDAKTYFSAHNKKYDIIISEPSNPWVSGVSGLFSEEFYRLVSRYLNDKGLFVQWMQLYEIDLPLVMSVLKSVSLQFADFVVYAPSYGDILIVASNQQVPEPGPGIFASPELDMLLKRVSMRNLQDIQIRMVGNSRVLRKFIETFPVQGNSDYYPVLDQNATRARFMKADAREMLSLASEPLPILELLGGQKQEAVDTHVTPTPFYPHSLEVYRAMQLRDLILQKSRPEAGSPELSAQAAALRQIFYDCAAVPDDMRTSVLFNTALRLVPNLRPEELERIWRSLESGSCTATMTKTDTSWLIFFKALGRRDAAGIVQTAGAMIDGGLARTEPELRYLLAAEMAGNLAQGETGRMRKRWATHPVLVSAGPVPGMLFRVLQAGSSEAD
ncbi:MAG: spermidine synthase [Thermodesulfovibrio sp.]|nr:spermidine synthase [Thermodesulfovibrio sp.]